MKVLLIEDEEKVVRSLQKGLQEHHIAVDCALDGVEGLQLARAEEYDVIVSDVIVPGIHGTDLIRQLRTQGNRTPVLMLTALSSLDNKVEGLEAGADDYMTKPFEFRELLARIKALARRSQEPGVFHQVLSFGGIELNLTSREIYRDNIKVELTPKEFALMEYFIRNKGRAVSKSEIAEKVWDIHFETSSNVVEVYVNYLRNKIDKPFANKLIHTVFGQGYILKEEG
jgi:two-component system copper resistance phosphate regulon response regulator CusR